MADPQGSRRRGRDVHRGSISLKGFKSFPDRTRLDFCAGRLGDRRPKRVGQVERDRRGAVGARRAGAGRRPRPVDARPLIFGGARRRPGARSAEVEWCSTTRTARSTCRLSELSIMRRLNRDGEGEYRINGARCRLVDVTEGAQRHGPGKEMHSVSRRAGWTRSSPRSRKDRRAADRGGRGSWQAPQAPCGVRSSSWSPRRTTSTVRSTSSARRGRACGRSSGRPRPPSRTSGWSGEYAGGAAGRSRARTCARAASQREADARTQRRRRRARARDAPRAELSAIAAAPRAAEQRAREPAPSAASDRPSRPRRALRAAADRDASSRRAPRGQHAVRRAASRRALLRVLTAAVARLSARLRRPDQVAGASCARGSCWRRIRRATLSATRRRARAGAPRRARAAAECVRLAAERRRTAATAVEAADQAANRAPAPRAARAQPPRPPAGRPPRRRRARTADQFLRTHAGAPNGAPALRDELERRAGLRTRTRRGARPAAARRGRGRPRGRAARLLHGRARRRRRAVEHGRPQNLRRGPGAAPSAVQLSEAPSADPTRRRRPARGRLLAGVWVVDDLGAIADGVPTASRSHATAGRSRDRRARAAAAAPRGGEDRVLAERNRRESLIAQSEGAARDEQGGSGRVETGREAVARRPTRRARGRSRRRARRPTAPRRRGRGVSGPCT